MPITNRSFPTFSLTHTTAVTILRKSGKGDYDDDGNWVEAVPQEIVIEANVQPTPRHEIEIMVEADRTKEWITLYSVSEIRTANEAANGWDADEVVWDGYTFKVMKSQHWKM